VPLLVDGVQFDAAIVTVSEQYYYYYYYYLYSSIIIISLLLLYARCGAWRTWAGRRNDLPLLVDGVQFDTAIVTVSAEC